jgi:Mn2+/Fe2+ NRAMP family transporter
MKNRRQNNKQRVFIMVLYIIWFAIGNLCRQHFHLSLPLTLLINSVILPIALFVPLAITYDMLGGRKFSKDFLLKDLNMP